MAFEQNQQDAFNLRNDTDSLKRLEAELDKATTAIGAAEVAAEEGLAALKLKNLAEQHEARLKKLDELIKKEEAGIRKLAALRLELSDKQFEARKKEIQKELQLIEKARKELDDADTEKTKKYEESTKKQVANTGTASKADQAASEKDSGKATDPKLINLVSSIDKTLTSLQDTLVKQSFSKKEGPSADAETQQTSTVKDLQNPANTKTTDISDNNIGNLDSTGGTGNDDVTKSGIGQADTSKNRDYVSDSGKMKAVDLGRYSFEDILESFDGLKSSLDTSELKALNRVTDRGSKHASQQSVDLAGAFLKSYEDTEAAERKLQEFNANIELNARLAFLKNEQDTKKRYLDEYQRYLEEAGEYAISREEFLANKARQDLETAKNQATDISKLFSDIKSGKFNLTDYKESASKYINKRTKELNKVGKFDKEDKLAYMKELKANNPGMTSQEAKALADKKAAEAEAAEKSAKLSASFELLASAAGNLAKMLDEDVKKISAMQGIVDTRLQGSQTNERDFGNGSYWNQLLEDAKKIAGASPFIKQEKLVDNIKTLVEKGISFDIKQRAFLMTIQEKIANTFNVADGTLLRLIRIQQEDTTAGRLGMESALNGFLNSMYETSEYLENVAANVRSSLEEMQALMEGAAGTEVEFQVQKWMGSLYSVGMSDRAVQDIANTFGQIASGDVGGLTGSGTGNLLIMAANEAGMSIADILQEGLDADETNKLMQAMVNYLAEIAETSSNSKVVQQQLANVYGIKASDLRAATNLATSLNDVSKQDLSYGGMLGQLESMMNTIRYRTSIGEGMTNMWDNMMYSMASTQASNPILYALPKMADLLRDVTGGGGIALPFVNVMGFGVDLNTSVADLMSVASMAGTALGSLGPLFTGIKDLFDSSVGSSMLSRAGISTSGKVPVLARGSATPLQNIRGASISESGQIVGNSSGDDIKKQTLQGAEDDKKKQMIKAKDEESADDTATKANFAVVNIYNLLEEVAHGSQSLRVRVINNNNAGGSGYSHNGSNNIIGENSGTGVTGAGANNGNVDNGNWVLAF